MDVLDIDPYCAPEVLQDARRMSELSAGQYQAVYCSHNLEHYPLHDVPLVLSGMLHVLCDGGTVEILVPNIKALMHEMLGRGLDIMDTCYRAGDSPISFHDVIYGWGAALSSGNEYYAHKCGFTRISLGEQLINAGFAKVHISEQGLDLRAKAIKG